MQISDDVIRVGISPVTPPQIFVELWPDTKIISRYEVSVIPFENTTENAREILGNLGKNIDVVAGIFDEAWLKLRGCDGIKISMEPFLCGCFVSSQTSQKEYN